MNRKLLLIALASSVFALSACKPEAPAEPTVEAAPAAEPAPVAAESMPSTSPAEVPFDVKGFAGTFTGTLASGVEAKVEFAADGTFKLNDTPKDKKGEAVSFDGTWTAEENGKRLRLDPNSKSEQDRVYAVTSHEQIDQLDAEGKAAEAASTLKRQMQ